MAGCGLLQLVVGSLWLVVGRRGLLWVVVAHSMF